MSQDGDYVFKHDSMEATAYEYVVAVEPRAVPHVLGSWQQWAGAEYPGLDIHYGLDMQSRALMSQPEWMRYLFNSTYTDEGGQAVRPSRH